MGWLRLGARCRRAMGQRSTGAGADAGATGNSQQQRGAEQEQEYERGESRRKK